MFDNNPLSKHPEETTVNPPSFSPDPQASYHSNVDYFGPYADWSSLTTLSPLEVDVVQVSQSYTSSPTQLYAPVISNHNSPRSSSDGAIASSLLRMESLPGQEEKRKAQNRNSQRAFRRRQASYITSLESELEELRTNYKNLLRFFSLIKEAVDSVGQDILGKDTQCKPNVAATSGGETPSWEV